MHNPGQSGRGCCRAPGRQRALTPSDAGTAGTGCVVGSGWDKDTESNVEVVQPTQGEVQLAVEERTVWQNSLLDAGLHWTLSRRIHLRQLPTATAGGSHVQLLRDVLTGR